MPSFYPYLISSLPMLNFKAKPPFTFDGFILKCLPLISRQDLAVLEGVRSENSAVDREVVKRWHNFEIALKNELVKVRASRKKIDPAKYLRPDGYADSSLHHLALAAQRNPAPQDAERLLDEARWKFLEELSFGHYFDLDSLIIYAYKLLILERWERIERADKERELSQILI